MERKQILGMVKSDDLWLIGEAAPNSNILITFSDQNGARSKLVTSQGSFDVKSKDFVQAPKERVSTKTQVRNRNIMESFRLAGVVFSLILITFSVMSFAGLVKARIVLTNSMLPTISAGDIVLLANPNRLKPEIGSVVAYTAKRFDGSDVGVFTHRIIGGTAEEGFLVKGDSNPTPDTQRPLPEDINGVVFFVVPFIGKLLSVKSLALIIPALLGLWMILDALRDED